MTKSDNEARRRRILDAAADLFVHYGFDKTAVSDIARNAGVSKGAIYLHFSSKDELLEGLIMRETIAYQERWLDLIENDPQGGTIGSMYKNILYALNVSPFMMAMFKQDSRILGNYLRKPNNLFRRQGHRTRFAFVTMMQQAGAIREDVDAEVTAHIMDMLAYGLVSMQDIKPKEAIPPTEAIIEGIADLMDRALTPADGGNSEAGKKVVRQISDAARRAFEAGDG